MFCQETDLKSIFFNRGPEILFTLYDLELDYLTIAIISFVHDCLHWLVMKTQRSPYFVSYIKVSTRMGVM